MIGAILGDIIGSPYEFDRGNKSKDFPLFSRKSTYTDDTVMTLAVGLTFLDAQPSASDDWILRILANRMRQFGKMYPNAGYGGMFRQWLCNPECRAYNSFGNGSAMRVSSVAWLYNDIDAVRHAAGLSAEVTHNHPEGIKGAEATASAIFLARTGHSKAEIKRNTSNSPTLQARYDYWVAFNDYAFQNNVFSKQFNKRKAKSLFLKKCSEQFNNDSRLTLCSGRAFFV